jgi:hypothetical protein
MKLGFFVLLQFLVEANPKMSRNEKFKLFSDSRESDKKIHFLSYDKIDENIKKYNLILLFFGMFVL